VVEQELDALIARAGMIDMMMEAMEELDDEPTQRVVVLDQQNAHNDTPWLV
jgi:hypothetical protein